MSMYVFITFKKSPSVINHFIQKSPLLSSFYSDDVYASAFLRMARYATVSVPLCQCLPKPIALAQTSRKSVNLPYLIHVMQQCLHHVQEMLFCCSNQVQFGRNNNQKGGFQSMAHASKNIGANTGAFNRGFKSSAERPFKFYLDRQDLARQNNPAAARRGSVELPPNRAGSGFKSFARNTFRSLLVGVKFS